MVSCTTYGVNGVYGGMSKHHWACYQTFYPAPKYYSHMLWINQVTLNSLCHIWFAVIGLSCVQYVGLLSLWATRKSTWQVISVNTQDFLMHMHPIPLKACGIPEISTVASVHKYSVMLLPTGMSHSYRAGCKSYAIKREVQKSIT